MNCFERPLWRDFTFDLVSLFLKYGLRNVLNMKHNFGSALNTKYGLEIFSQTKSVVITNPCLQLQYLLLKLTSFKFAF